MVHSKLLVDKYGNWKKTMRGKALFIVAFSWINCYKCIWSFFLRRLSKYVLHWKRFYFKNWSILEGRECDWFDHSVILVCRTSGDHPVISTSFLFMDGSNKKKSAEVMHLSELVEWTKRKEILPPCLQSKILVRNWFNISANLILQQLEQKVNTD